MYLVDDISIDNNNISNTNVSIRGTVSKSYYIYIVTSHSLLAVTCPYIDNIFCTEYP